MIHAASAPQLACRMRNNPACSGNIYLAMKLFVYCLLALILAAPFALPADAQFRRHHRYPRHYRRHHHRHHRHHRYHRY